MCDLFHDTLAPQLAAYSPEASEAQQRDFLPHQNQTLHRPSTFNTATIDPP